MAPMSQRFPGVRWVRPPVDFIRIDAEKCSGCGDCMKVCLAGCFVVEQKVARIKSLDECMECGSCWYICDREAILFSWPRGGTGFGTRFG